MSITKSLLILAIVFALFASILIYESIETNKETIIMAITKSLFISALFVSPFLGILLYKFIENKKDKKSKVNGDF